MHPSPRLKEDKLLSTRPETLETGGGRDGIPDDVWENLQQHERSIYYSLMFVNGAVLWAYYSCLSAQDFYAVKFAHSGLDFSFLTTMVTSWPMVLGQLLQLVLGVDKKLTQSARVHAGFALFAVMAVLIMVFSGAEFASQKTGGTLVLVCFAAIGLGNSLSEATFYTLAALFPMPKFSNAVQIGNVCAGVLNISVNTLLRLAVGGVHATGDATSTAFYLFFSLLLVVLLTAIVLYRRMIALPCIRFLLDRNDEASAMASLHAQSTRGRLVSLWRIFAVIRVPACAQFLIFFVSLSVFPGFGCSAARNFSGPPYSAAAHPTTALWYCSPGIVGSYNYGDFLGRVLCSAAAYRVLTMNLSLGLTVLRLAYIPLLLLGVAGTSLYSFGYNSTVWSLVYNVVLTFTIGLSNGLLSTVTMGVAPRLLKPEDRESGGAIMVLFLFTGIAMGSTFGYLVSEHGWFGL